MQCRGTHCSLQASGQLPARAAGANARRPRISPRACAVGASAQWPRAAERGQPDSSGSTRCPTSSTTAGRNGAAASDLARVVPPMGATCRKRRGLRPRARLAGAAFRATVAARDAAAQHGQKCDSAAPLPTPTHSSRSPPSQGGRPLGPRGEPLALRWRSRGSSGTLWAGKWPDLGRTEPPTSLLLHCALDHHVDHPGSRNSTASGSTPSAAGGAVAEPVKARAGRSCPLLCMLGSEHHDWST